MIINAETGAAVDLINGPGDSWWTPRATAAFLAGADAGGAGAVDDSAAAAGDAPFSSSAASSSYARLVQGECAALRGDGAPPGAALGSQDATTCVVLALWWPAAAAAAAAAAEAGGAEEEEQQQQQGGGGGPLLWLAHLDAAPGEREARRLARLMAERGGGGGPGPALYLVGAYDQQGEEEEEEARGSSSGGGRRRGRPATAARASVATSALLFVARAAELASAERRAGGRPPPPPPRLALACVGARNTALKGGAPLATALAVDVATGVAHPRVEQGGTGALPRQAQRLAAALTGQRRGARDLVEVEVVVAAGGSTLEVRAPPPPRGWQRPWGSGGGGGSSDADSPLAGLRRLLALRGPQFVRRVSTSPLHEPPWFAEEMREQFSWVVHEVERFFSKRGAAAAARVEF